jgi:hypothetical protein
MADKQIEPGQLTSLQASNYDINKDLGKVVDRTGNVDIPSSTNLLLDNPLGGKNGEPINPALASYMNIIGSTKINPLQQAYYTNLPQTERYSTNKWGGYNPFDLNQEDWYGKQQGWLSQWGNHLGKFAIKTVGSFAGALMDIPNIIHSVAAGDVSKMWDNPVNNWANDLMDWGEKVMPNYKTNFESEHPFLNLIPFYGNAANSWGNVLEQTGFTVGAIGGAVVEDALVGAITGGVGEVPLAAMQINKLVYRLGKAINAGDEFLDTLKSNLKNADEIVKGLKGIDRFNYAVRQGLWGANMITSGMSEAAYEGIESYRTLSKDLAKEFYDQNGRAPDYEEQKKIEQTGKDAANTRFILNTALLSVTNTIQWGSLLRPFNITKDLIEAEAKSGVRIALKEGSKELFEAVSPISKMAKLSNFLKNNSLTNAFVGSASEGFEEGAQFVIQNGVDDYYKRKYHGEAISDINNFMKSFGYGMAQTLGTTEGWENIVYGLLGGALYKAGEHAYYRANGVHKTSYKDQIDSVIKGLNSQSLTGIFENKYGEAVTASSIHKDLQDAVKNNNIFLYKNFKHEQFVNFILSGIKQNKFNTRMDQIQELKKLDDADFAKTFGIPSTSDNRKTISDYVEEMSKNANYIKDIHTRVSRTFINPFNFKGTGNYKDAKQAAAQLTENENHLAYEGVKDQLVYAMSSAKDSIKRIEALRRNIINTDSFIDPDLVVKLSSDEGLKTLKNEYTKRVKEIEDSMKIAPNPKLTEEYNWTKARIGDIEGTLNAKDSKEESANYNKLIGEVFDKSKELADTIDNGGKLPQNKSIYPRVLINDLLKSGKDIFYLQKRNEAAINNYAALTTKGGFKKLFDNIKQIRQEAVQQQVPLTGDADSKADALAQITQKATPEQATATKSTDVQEQVQGTETTSTEDVSPDEKTKFSKILIDILEGRYKAQEPELEFFGAKSLDDLKFDDPKVDLSKYTMVKSLGGRNYYIPNSVIAQAKLNLEKGKSEVAEFHKTAEASAPANIGNVNDIPPQEPNEKAGLAPFRTDDFLGKVFVPTDLKVAFNNAIFSGPAAQVKQDLSVTVRALSPEYQAQYDQQKANQSYTPLANYPGLYIAKAPIDLSIAHNGVEIGKIGYPERLLFKIGDEYLTIDKITPQQYAELTGKAAAQHAGDVEEFRAQVAFKNYLALRFKNNNNQEITLSPQEVNDLFDTIITYGEYDLVPPGGIRPTLAELKHNTIMVADAENKPVPSMAIISVPKRYSNDTFTLERTEFVNTIFSKAYYESGYKDYFVSDLIAQQVESLHKIGSRYISAVQLPDGTIGLVALRPAEMKDSEKHDLFTRIKERAAESVKANFVQSTKENADGALLIGDQEVYYKLPSDEAKKFNDEFNTNLNNEVFISDPNARSFFNISVSPIGAIRFEIYDRIGKYRDVAYISPQRVESVKDFPHMLEIFNKEIEKKAKGIPELRELNVKITSSNFRQNIADDTKVVAEDVADKLTAATTTEVFKNGTMRLVPRGATVTQAYKKAGGRFKSELAPELQKQESPAETAAVPTEQQGTLDDRRADIERRREEELRKEFGNNLDTILKNIDTINERTDKRGIEIVEKLDAINAKYDAELAALEESKPQEQTTPQATPQETTSLINQEDIKNIEFPTVADALAAVDVGFRFKTDDTIEFYSISSGEILDYPGFSPSDLVKELGLNVKSIEKPKDDGGFEFKLSDGGQAELRRMLDIERAKAYIASVLPSFIKVEDIAEVLNRVSVKGEVFGAFSNGVIYLNKQAEAGTEYHEAFHGVFRMLLSDEQIDTYLKEAQSSLYTQLKKQGKSINDLLKERRNLGLYQNLSTKEAYDRLYEEHMADRYKAWKEKKESAGFFDKLFDLINRLFKWITRDKKDLDFLFRSIDRGDYKYSSIVANRFTQDMTDEFVEPEYAFQLIPARPGSVKVGTANVNVRRNLDAKTSKQVVQTVASYYNLYRQQEQYQHLTDEHLLNNILDDLKNLYDPSNPQYATQSEAYRDRLATSDKSFIYSNEDSREAIKDGAKKYINSIRYIEQFQEDAQDFDEQDEGAPSTGYDNRAENNGGFTSLPGMLRQYIGFTSYEITDKFGNKQIADGVPMVATVDAISVYYGLLRSLANITDPVKFFQKMVMYASNSNEQSRHFVEKFIKDTGLDVDKLIHENKLEATQNRALVELVKKGFNKYRIDYIFTRHDIRKSIVESFPANRRNVENVQFDKWANEFISGYLEHSEETQKAIRSSINDIRNRYFEPRRTINYTEQRVNEAISEMQHAFKGIGLQLSNDYLKYSLLAQNAKKFDEINESYKKEGSQLQFDDPQNKFISREHYEYVKIMEIADEITLNKDFLDELTKTLASGANPFFKEITTVEKFDEETQALISTDEEIDTAMVGRLPQCCKG